MSPELSSFLTKLYNDLPVSLKMPEAADRARQLFYDYLHSKGVEHCNYGGFELGGGSELAPGQLVEFSGSTLPEPFIEEFTCELAEDDYVMLKAGELSETRPFSSFDVGFAHLDQIESFNPRSREVQLECARHGIGDGVAMIGNSPSTSCGRDSRFFGFVFANTDISGGEHIRANFSELQIAAFALLERIKPRMEASIDRFAYDLTAREKDILGALAGGAQRQEIAWRLNISVHTVDMHSANLRRKMGAQTLAEAVGKGYRYGAL